MRIKSLYVIGFSVFATLCAHGAGKRARAPWDCVRDALELYDPQRAPIAEAAKSLEATLSSRPDVKGVAPAREKSFLVVMASTAVELRHVDAQYGLKGYLGYAVVPEIGLRHPSLPAEIYPSGDPRNRQLYEQSLLVKFPPEGVKLRDQGEWVPYDLKLAETSESKMGYELRAQLASDQLRFVGGWNPDRRILLAVHPSRMHWCYLHNLFMEDVGIPQEEDLNQAAPKVLTEFVARHKVPHGLRTFGERVLFGGSSRYLLVSVPTAADLLKVLADENVSTADIAENFEE